MMPKKILILSIFRRCLDFKSYGSINMQKKSRKLCEYSS